MVDNEAHLKRRKMHDTNTNMSSKGYYRKHRSFTMSRTKANLRKWTHYVENSHQRSTFRVVSFNVLADYIVQRDGLLQTNHAWKYDWSYRCTRLIQEILTWKPDVICLQEVDHFDDFFQPELEKHGFTGVYKKRTGDDTLDGCAIFVRKKNFRIVSDHAVEYKISDDHPLLNRDNIALALVVEWTQQGTKTTPMRFILANTHLLFNPGRGDVKLAQAQRLFKALDALQRQEEEDSGVVYPMILCGDFNMMPHSALYHFFSRGQLDLSGLSRYFLSGQNFEPKSIVQTRMFQKEQDPQRHHGHGTAPGRFDPIQAVRDDFRYFPEGTIASHEQTLASAYAQYPTEDSTGEPKYTSFHARFKGTVDYIWYTSHLVDCLGVAEMLPAGILFKQKELPNQHHSSDHLSLVADFAMSTT